MKFIRYILLLVVFPTLAQTDFKTFFEKGNGNQSATYEETIRFYTNLASHFPTLKIQEMGTDDSGIPLHLVIFNPEKSFDFNSIGKNKAVILINNAILMPANRTASMRR